ncbi:MAG: MopE-related protein [bacterium]
MKRRRFPICLLLISVLILWNCSPADSATVSFSAEQKMSTGPVKLVQPKIFCNRQSQIFLAWIENTGTRDSIFIRSSNDRGLNWSSPAIPINSQNAAVSSSADFQVCSDDTGHVYGVWVDIRNGSGGEVYFNYSADHGQTWQSHDIRINNGPAGVTNPQIACNRQGEVYVIWTDSRYGAQGEVFLNYSTDYGKTWRSEDLRLDSAPNHNANCRFLQITAAGNMVYVAWIDQGTASPGAYYSRSTDYGQTWTPRPLATGTSLSDLQMIRETQSDNVYIAWIQDGKKIYFKNASDDSTGSMQVNDINSGNCQNLRLACDSAKNVYAVWLDKRNGTDHVYESQCNIAVSGQQITWRVPRRVDGGYTNASYDPSIGCTNQGLVAVSWRQVRSSMGLNVFVNYSLNSGELWQNEIYLKKTNSSASSSANARLCCDETKDDIYVTWLDSNENAAYFNYSISTYATLDWIAQDGIYANGVDPDSGAGGSYFTFKVKYMNSQNIAPSARQIWVDENDNGIYEIEEKHDLWTDTQTFSQGCIYSTNPSLRLKYNPNSDHSYRYRFYFEASGNIATGKPAIDQTLTVTSPPPESLPRLKWVGTEGYTNDGVDPNITAPEVKRTFKVKFTSSYPSASYDMKVQVWIDSNDNGIYEGSEKYSMDPVQSNSDIYSRELTLDYRGDGRYRYRFYGYDPSSFATGDPAADRLVVVNSLPVLCGVEEGGYVRPGGENFYTFTVHYQDQDNDPPSVSQLWIDRNNDTKVQDEEKYDLRAADPNDDSEYSVGRDYTTNVFLLYEGPENLLSQKVTYKFDFSDSHNQADPNGVSCTPDYRPVGKLDVLHDGNSPVIDWTGEDGYQSAGVKVTPGPGGIGYMLAFRVRYTDVDNDPPGPRRGDWLDSGYETWLDPGYEVWVDLDDDGIYEPVTERLLMDEYSHNSSGTYTGLYTLPVYIETAPQDGNLKYRFFFHDGKNMARGNAAGDRTVPFNLITFQRVNTPDSVTAPCVVTFRVKYTNPNKQLPDKQILWLDLNDDGIAQGSEELIMQPSTSNPDCTNGKEYWRNQSISYAGDGVLQYSFRSYVSNVLIAESEDYAITVSSTHAAPTLSYTQDAGYTNGVKPSKGYCGDTFTFKVRYQNPEGSDSCPDPTTEIRHQLWIDTNNNSEYESSEKLNPDKVENDVYTFSKVMNVDGGGEFSYRFYFNNCFRSATGAPTLAKTIMIDRLPTLTASVDPNRGNGGGTFQFQTTYKDLDNDPPPSGLGFLWIDFNDDGFRQEGEKFSLAEKDAAQKSYKEGKEYRPASQPTILFDPALIIFYDSEASNHFTYQFFMGDANSPTGIVEVKKVGNVPTLDEGTASESEDVDGRFTFHVRYTDVDGAHGDPPGAMQVWVDENGNGVYEFPAERHAMSQDDSADTEYKDGKYYSWSGQLSNNGQAKILYRFYAHDGKNLATGEPTQDGNLFLNHRPELKFAKVTPGEGNGGTSFTFQVTYYDQDEDTPRVYQVWIDENGNGTYEDNEKQYNLLRKDPIDKKYSEGVLYEKKINLRSLGGAQIPFLFCFSDRTSAGSEVKTEELRVKVNVSGSQPVLSWVSGTGYQQDGVDPNSSPTDTRFSFKVLYKDADGDAPENGKVELWVEHNTDPSTAVTEKFLLTSSSQNPITAGRIYSLQNQQFSRGGGDGVFTYWFWASDGKNFATGAPVQGGKFSINHAPELSWPQANATTGARLIDSDKWIYEFQVRYYDADGDSPVQEICWIDVNGNGQYGSDEAFLMVPKGDALNYSDPNGVIFTFEKTLTCKGNGTLKYKMAFKDQGSLAVGKPDVDDPTEDHTVKVNNRYYLDQDRDSYGDPNHFIEQCNVPTGYVDFAKMGEFDLDDSDSHVYPGAPEICDGKDNDGNGEKDDNPRDGIIYYEDWDGDGYGNALSIRRFCPGVQPAGWVRYASDDCNDLRADIHPGASEICDDGIDNNCDGIADNGSVKRYYHDKDNDGFGDPSDSMFFNECSGHPNYVENARDCNDSNSAINPSAQEIHCNGLDDDCTSSTPDNHPPELQFIPPQVVYAGQPVTFCPDVDDADGDEVDISYSGWMTSDSRTTGLNDVGNHWVTVTAKDSCDCQNSSSCDNLSSQKVLIMVTGLGTIQGKVTGKESGNPIANAVIQVKGMRGKYTESDTSGRFTLPDLPPGQYSLIVSAPEYAREITGKTTLCAGKTVVKDIQLSHQAGKVASEILELVGEDDEQYEVPLHRNIMVTATSLLGTVYPYFAQTDSDGRYQLYLPKGTFKLAAFDPNGQFDPVVEINLGKGFAVNPDQSENPVDPNSRDRLKLKVGRNVNWSNLPDLRITSMEKWDRSDVSHPILVTTLFFYPQEADQSQIKQVDLIHDPNFVAIGKVDYKALWVDDGQDQYGNKFGHYEATYYDYYEKTSTTTACAAILCTISYGSSGIREIPYRFIIHPKSTGLSSSSFPISQTEVRTTMVEGGHAGPMGYTDAADSPDRAVDLSGIDIPPYALYPIEADTNNAVKDVRPLRVCMNRSPNTISGSLGEDVVSSIYDLRILEPLTASKPQDTTASSWVRINADNPVTVSIQIDMNRIFDSQASEDQQYQDANSTILDDIEIRYLDSSSSWKTGGIDNIRLTEADPANNSTGQRHNCVVAFSIRESRRLAVFQVRPKNLLAEALSDTKVMLSWQDRSLTEEGFEIWRKVKGEAEYQKVSRVLSNVKSYTDVMSYTDSGLLAKTTYLYKVCTIRSLNKPETFSSFSDPVEVTTEDPSKNTGGGSGGSGNCFISAIKHVFTSEQVKWWAW